MRFFAAGAARYEAKYHIPSKITDTNGDLSPMLVSYHRPSIQLFNSPRNLCVLRVSVVNI